MIGRVDFKQTSIVVSDSPWMAPLFKADAPQRDAEISETRNTQHKEVVGLLTWIVTMTRPDLSSAVNGPDKCLRWSTNTT